MTYDPRAAIGRLGLDQLGVAQHAYRAISSGRNFARGYRFARTFPSAGLQPRAADQTPSDLERYATLHTTGPGIFKWNHYFDVYDRHLARFRNERLQLVEVGVAGGGSLGMWRNYLGDTAQICGIDIDPECRRFADDRVEIVIGDQGDDAFWAAFLEDHKNIDIFIDDGSHLPEHQVTTIERVLPAVRSGGVYICEDIHGALQPFHSYVDGLTRALSAIPPGGASTPNSLQAEVASVHHYPLLTVIEKTSDVPPTYEAQRYGDEWPEQWHT